MENVTKVITLINELKDAKSLIQNSFDISKRLDIVMEIIFVCELPLFDIPSFFKSSDDTIDLNRIKNEINNIIKDLDIKKDIAIFVYIDDSLDRVKHLIQSPHEIIIMSYKKSISKMILENINNPILIMKKDKDIKSSITIVNFSSKYKSCLINSNYLFPEIQNSIIYDYRYIIDPTMQSDLQNIKELEDENRKKFKEILDYSSLDGDFFIDNSISKDKLIGHIAKSEVDLVIDCTNNHDISFAKELDCNLLYFNRE